MQGLPLLPGNYFPDVTVRAAATMQVRTRYATHLANEFPRSAHALVQERPPDRAVAALRRRPDLQVERASHAGRAAAADELSARTDLWESTRAIDADLCADERALRQESTVDEVRLPTGNERVASRRFDSTGISSR